MQPAGGRGGMGPGGHHQHADPLHPHAVCQSQPRRGEKFVKVLEFLRAKDAVNVFGPSDGKFHTAAV